MTYLVSELVTRAWYLSGIVSRRLQVPTGEQISDGIFLLNDLLSEKSVDYGLIPYWKEEPIAGEIGTEKYFIEGLVTWETFTFNINEVRFSVQNDRREHYHGSSRVDNITALPGKFYLERVLGGSDLYVYFLPNADYPMKIWGKFALDEADAEDDLSEIYDRFYINYMRYELARTYCDEYKKPFYAQDGLDARRNKLMSLSPKDMTMRKQTAFGDSQGFNWAYANLYSGWDP